MDPFTLLTSGLAFNQKKNDKGLRAFGHSLRDTKDGPTTAPAPVPESENPMSHLAAHASELPQTNDPLEAANLLRKAFRIKVKGDGGCPPPLRAWSELPSLVSAKHAGEDTVHAALLATLAAEGMPEPSAVQRQTTPAILADREVLAVAPTGSGKTLAYLLPVLLGIRRRMADAAQRGALRGVKGVVLSPTRELAGQIHRIALRVARPLQLTVALVSKIALKAGVGGDLNKYDLLIATPQRLGEMVGRGAVDLSRACYLILDEADRLFDGGFVAQIDRVIDAVGKAHREEPTPASAPAAANKKGKRAGSQAAPPAARIPVLRCLFSATLPDKVEEMARTVLHAPLRITVGERNTAAATVRQRLVFVGKESGKLLTLRQMFRDGQLAPPVLVFVESKERAKELHRELMYEGVHVDSIHADQPQGARNAAVENFRAGKTWLLIATDLIGRGMDFLGVNTVINYDFPETATDYIHRIGRTGRAGRTGEAVTFYTEEDKGRLRSVAHLIKGSGGEVPDWMLQMKKTERRRRNKKRDREGRKGLLEEDSGSEGEAGPGPAPKEARVAAVPPPAKRTKLPVAPAAAAAAVAVAVAVPKKSKGGVIRGTGSKKT